MNLAEQLEAAYAKSIDREGINSGKWIIEITQLLYSAVAEGRTAVNWKILQTNETVLNWIKAEGLFFKQLTEVGFTNPRGEQCIISFREITEEYPLIKKNN